MSSTHDDRQKRARQAHVLVKIRIARAVMDQNHYRGHHKSKIFKECGTARALGRNLPIKPKGMLMYGMWYIVRQSVKVK